MRLSSVTPKYVESFPPETEMQFGTLYVSMPFGTLSHLCACGCGNEVVTPLRPGSWMLTYDGRTISLRPSIGNFQIPCQSHYFITSNQVVWLPPGRPHRVPAARSDASSEDRSKGTGWWRRLFGRAH